MRILCLASYPKEAAATRFRAGQFIGPLRERGIELELSPFLSAAQFNDLYKPGGTLKKAKGIAASFLRKMAEAVRVKKYDLLFVQREAMFFGPEIFERLFMAVGRMPMVLDLDDATYVRYESPTYGKAGSLLKCFGKTDRLIRLAEIVTCGNRFIAEYVENLGTRAAVIPTVADTEIFKPLEKNNDPPVIGWIGTHSTFAALERLFPVLERLAENYRFRLKIVGAGKDEIKLPGVEVENRRWSLEKEADDFRGLDIGLYPIFPAPHASKEWIAGKSGFKAIQYMACGVPFVMSPVGIAAEIGLPNLTHFNAESDEDWYNSLERLLKDPALRREMGATGRRHALENYTVGQQADKLEQILIAAGGK